MDSDKLKELFAVLPDLTPQSQWDEHRLALRKTVARSTDCSNFLKWATIQATMFVGDAPYIRPEYDALVEAREYWPTAIKDSGFGKPYLLPYANYTSGNYVHQAYHLKQWVDVTGLHPESLSHVIEIGPGYGALTVIMTRMGFRGLYIHRDFPEMDLLRTYYLSNTLVIPRTSDNGNKIRHFLFVAICSLSEVPLHDRHRLVSGVDADSYLIVYQPQWAGVNNQKWFEKFQEDRPNVRWESYPNPNYTNHLYLIGKRCQSR